MGKKIKLFLLPFPVHLISDFFCSSAVLELLHWTPGLPQRSSHLWVIVKISVLWGLLDSSCEGLELGHRPVQGPRLTRMFVCVLPVVQGGKGPPRSLGKRHWCWNQS